MCWTASGCVKDEIGKICSQNSRSYAALQSRPVKDPASAFSHNQDPEQNRLSALRHRPAAIEPAFGQIALPDADVEPSRKQARLRPDSPINSHKKIPRNACVSAQNGPPRGLAV